MLESLSSRLRALPDASAAETRGMAAAWRPGGLALLAICLLAYLPGLWAMPPVDRDEPRFAQASRQMFESFALPQEERDRRPTFYDGTWIIPKVQNQPRLKKPPMIYWLEAASAAVFTAGEPHRDAIWMYRVPSVLAAIASVLITWRLGMGMFDPRAAWLGAAFLAVAPVIVFDAHLSRADQALLTTVCLAQLALWRVWKARDEIAATLSPKLSWGMPLLFWFATGAGILTKGITPLISLSTIAALIVVTRRAAWLWRLRPLVGVLIVAAMLAPWLIGVSQTIGLAQYAGAVKSELITRGAEPQEGHWGPPGYHALLAGVLLWPGSIVLLPGLLRAWSKMGGAWWRRRATARPTAPKPPPAPARPSQRSAPVRSSTPHAAAAFPPRPSFGRSRRDAELFLLAWIVPAWLGFELYMTKLPHYTMPMYPALALLGARAVFTARSGRLPMQGAAWVKWALGAWVGIGVAWIAAGFISAGLALFGSELLASLGPLFALPLLALPAWLMYRTWKALTDSMFILAALQGIGVVLVAGAIVMHFIAPSLLGLSSRVSRKLAEADPTGRRPIASVDYHEDSMVFLTRGRVDNIDHASIDAWFAKHPDGAAVIPEKYYDPGDDVLNRDHAKAAILGYDYGNNKDSFRRLFVEVRKP